MSTVVIMPGGFHPFHAGHAALYQSAVKAFPDADVYVAATDDTSERPFPFAIKEKLARVAGIPPGRFVKVKSPFSSEEITSKYDPNKTVLIFVKSEKNAKGGSDPEGPFPAEVDPTTGKLPLVTRGARKGQPVSDRLQYYKGNENNLQPMSRHSYLAYLPTVEFGPGIKSGSELRSLWPKIDDRRKTAFVMSMYPATQKNPKLAATVVKMIDMGMGGQQGVAEGKYTPASTTEEDIFIKGKKVGKITKITTKKGMVFYSAEIGNSSTTGADTREEAIRDLKRLISWKNKKGVAEGYSNTTFNVDRRKLNVPALIQKGAIFVTYPHGEQGWETDNREDWAFSLLSLYNVLQGGWPSEAKKYLKPESYRQAEQQINSSAPNLGSDKLVYDGKYNQILWSIKKLGIPEDVAFLDKGQQGMAEGEVIPFARKPQPKLTWQQVPKDVLLLANEWFWADEDDMGLDAVLDPKGYGSGTSNDLKYITAKLQQKGWTIEHDLDDNRPDQFNMKLTNKLGQSVLLPWADAQDFKGWAAGTRPNMSEGDENQYRRPSSSEVARVSQQTQAKLNPVRSKFVWKKPNQIGGSFSEQELVSKGFKKSQFNSWGGTQMMWDRLLPVKEARVLFNNPNTLVNVYYNSRNPKYYGKPVLVGKQIPYNKVDSFINMIVSKYDVKPTEFIWTDASNDSTDAHIAKESLDYLEEK